MCLLLEQMRNEVAEKTVVEQAIDHARLLIRKFRLTSEEAVETLEVPEAYRAAVLAALQEG